MEIHENPVSLDDEMNNISNTEEAVKDSDMIITVLQQKIGLYQLKYPG